MAEEQKEQKTHQQHPIPQNVMGVEFKLVGGLTLRQFLFLAGFILTAWLIYSSGLPSFIKTPVAAAVAIFGAFISLVPIQDRSADIWLKNFLLAVSSPTERVWRKGSANLDIFFELREARTAIAQQKETGITRDRSQLTQYLRNSGDDEMTPMDLAEKEYLKSITILQNDVSLPSGMQSVVKTVPETDEKPQDNVVREEVDVAPTLASEVNYSQEKVIAIPGIGQQTKFVTPIQNTRTGRRIRLVKPGEIGLSVAGEKKVEGIPAIQKQAEELASKVDEVGKKIEQAQETVKLAPQATQEPAMTAVQTPQLKQALETAQHPIVENLGTPIPLTHEETTKAPAAPDLQNQASSSNSPILPPVVGSEPPLVTPTKQEETKNDDTVKMASLSEELAKLQAEKQKLLDDLEKQKKARLEAETYASMAAEYQKRANEASQQSSTLVSEMRKAQEELHRLRDVAQRTTSEKDILAKQIKENERRVLELSREKSQTTDSLISMQRELRELRLKSRFAQAPQAVEKVVAAKPQPVGTAAAMTAGILPFIKDTPNIINGYVRGKTGNLIKNAVVIINDSEGSPVRALKTNELGQFAITTAVINGAYTVEVSSDGETFAIMTVDVYGSVLEPLDFVGI